MAAKVWGWMKKEAVLCIAFVCAAVSAFWVPPTAAWLGYIDWNVLMQLFCLMAVVAGLQASGLFDWMGRRLLAGRKSFRLLCGVLVLLPFFSSMLITNDVALLTFVPFAVLLLGLCGRAEQAPLVVVLQTAAANLGSMALPMGNPQNLYLYSRYEFSFGEFLALVGPFAAVSLVGVLLPCLLLPDQSVQVRMDSPAPAPAARSLALFGTLFVLCLLSVLHVLPVPVVFVVTLAALLLSRSTLRTVDYSLLATFVCFFIFSGNLGAIPAVRGLLEAMLARSTLFTAAAASQLISNVPAAVLLSGFTNDGAGLLLGTDLGGLGTPVASLASLISLKLYARSPNARMGRFLGWFAAVNLAGLVVLLAMAWAMGLA